MQAQLYLSDVDKRTRAQQLLAERYKKQLDTSELERGKLAEQVTNLNDMVKQLSESTEQARAEGKKEMEKEMREEMEREKKKAYDEGFSKGYDKAGDELVDQVEKAEAIFKQEQHSMSYIMGYCKALSDTGEAVDGARREAIEVPSLVESAAYVIDEEEEEVADPGVDTNAPAEEAVETPTTDAETANANLAEASVTPDA
jgi:hypothetical protein